MIDHMGAPLCWYPTWGVGRFVWKMWVGLRLSDGVTTWLRLQTTVEGIPHPHQIYRKGFSRLVCCDWLHGCTIMLIRHLRCGWICLENVGRAETKWWCTGIVEALKHHGLHPTSPSYSVLTTWLRLQTTLDYIPHPHHIYRKCFRTLVCYDWSHGCTLVLIPHLRCG